MDGKVSRTLFLFRVASLIIHGMLEYSRSSVISLLLDVWLTTWEVNSVLFISVCGKNIFGSITIGTWPTF